MLYEDENDQLRQIGTGGKKQAQRTCEIPVLWTRDHNNSES